jgi:hypothetical protein
MPLYGDAKESRWIPAFAGMTASHHVIRRQLARLRAGLDLYGRVMHVIARAQLFAHSRDERVAGMPVGHDHMHGERGSVVLFLT